MQTRNFIILLILIPLLLLGGAALYFLGPWGKETGQRPEAGASKIEVFISEPVISPILSFDREKVWYMTREGKLYRTSITPTSSPPISRSETGGEREGVEEYLLPEPITSPIKITWPLTGNDFIIELSSSSLSPGGRGQGEGENSQYALYDSAAKKFHYYPPSLQKPVFWADPSKIIYDWQRSDGQHELKVSDKNGENFHKIADLRRPDYEIVPSPTKEEVAIFGSDNLEPSYLILVNLGTGEFKDIDGKAFYENVRYSPDGTKLAVTRSPSSPSTGEDKGEGEGLRVYDLSTFSPSPRAGEGGGEGEFTWSPDGKSIILGTKLGFFKYDLASGQQTEIYKFKEGEDFEPSDLILHSTRNLLFFVDRKTGWLHRLEY